MFSFFPEKINFFNLKVSNNSFQIFCAILLGVSFIFFQDFSFGFDLLKKESFCGVAKELKYSSSKYGGFYWMHLEEGGNYYSFPVDSQWGDFKHYNFSTGDLGKVICVKASWPLIFKEIKLVEIVVNNNVIYSESEARKFYLNYYIHTKYVSLLGLLIFLCMLVIYSINCIENKRGD